MKILVDNAFWYLCPKCGKSFKLIYIGTPEEMRDRPQEKTLIHCYCGRREKLHWGK